MRSPMNIMIITSKPNDLQSKIKFIPDRIIPIGFDATLNHSLYDGLGVSAEEPLFSLGCHRDPSKHLILVTLPQS